MQKTVLGKTGYTVSAVSYGGIVSSAHYSDFVFDGDGQTASDSYVAWAIERGVNYFDVAPAYGDAQEKLGHSLIPYRKNVYLACKTGYRDAANARKEMENSLSLLHTDYLDTYQMHALSTMEDVDRAFAPGGVMELMDAMKQHGYTRCVGFTAHDEAVALRALSLYDFDSVLFPFNWQLHLLYGMGNRLLKVCKEKNIGVLCMKSMIERAWNDATDAAARAKYPKSWCKPIDEETDAEFLSLAVRYVLSLGVDTLIPPGNFGHFRFAVEHIDQLMNRPLTSLEMQTLKIRLEKGKAYPFFVPSDANQ